VTVGVNRSRRSTLTTHIQQAIRSTANAAKTLARALLFQSPKRCARLRTNATTANASLRRETWMGLGGASIFRFSHTRSGTGVDVWTVDPDGTQLHQMTHGLSSYA